MAADQQFCLRWNNHQSTLISVFDTLLESGTLVDCTLAAEGQYLKAHKVVLSACSPYLEVLLSQHYEKHPIVILKDVKFQELKSMMDYMYRGEVNISQDQLGTFLKAAESLQIKGLSDSGGGDSDARDVASTKTQRHDPPPPPPQNPRKTLSAPQPRSPAVLPHSSGLTIEPRRTAPHLQPHLADVPDSPPVNTPILRSREGSVSPSLRKRRRTRRSSQGDDSNLPSDSQLETSNSCDLPSQSTPLVSGSVPNIPATMTPIVPSPAPSLKTMDNEHSLETDHLNRLGMANLNSSVVESGLIKEKIEPSSEILLEPKTEYLDEMNNEDSVEDLTLDDDDDMDGSMDMSRPGPSHATDGSSQQGFAPWHMSGDRSTDEVFMAAQEAVGAHRDSQGYQTSLERSRKIKDEVQGSKPRRRRHISMVETSWKCPDCAKCYVYLRGLNLHRRYECGKEPMFQCPFCMKKCHQPGNLAVHVRNKHPQTRRIAAPHPEFCEALPRN